MLAEYERIQRDRMWRKLDLNPAQCSKRINHPHIKFLSGKESLAQLTQQEVVSELSKKEGVLDKAAWKLRNKKIMYNQVKRRNEIFETGESNRVPQYQKKKRRKEQLVTIERSNNDNCVNCK